MRLLRISVFGLVMSACALAPLHGSALPTGPQPVVPPVPQGPANSPDTADCIATRNFTSNTPGAAITGGVFNGYGIPGFFGGDPGAGTGGWVSTHPCS